MSGPFSPSHGQSINLMSEFVFCQLCKLLSRGMQSSMAINRLMDLVKCLIILIFVFVWFFYVQPANVHPYMPFGAKGVLSGAACVFLSYLGLYAVSASAPVVKQPQKTYSRGIIGTLIIATICYVCVAMFSLGMVPLLKLDVADPVSLSLGVFHHCGLGGFISVGALAGMFTKLVTKFYSSSRQFYAIGRVGCCPRWFGHVSGHYSENALWTVVLELSCMGGCVPLNQLFNLVNMSTLMSLSLFSIGIIPLRRHEAINNQGFQVPGYPESPMFSFLFVLCQ